MLLKGKPEVKLEFLGVVLKLRKAQVGMEIFWNYVYSVKEKAPLSFREGRKGYSPDAWLANFIFLEHVFWKLFFVIYDLKVLHDLLRTWIINWYSWFYHSVLCDWDALPLNG